MAKFDEGLPIPGNENKRKTADLLPRFFRTEANKKFLESTLDQLTQPGVAEKVNGYIGRKNAKAFTVDDSYIEEVSSDRENYKLEPALVIKDNNDNVTFYKDYNDYVNQVSLFGGNAKNHSRLNSQDSYSWNPNIDWDKFTNFREYYWLPTGPQPIPVRGQSTEVVSTYTVTTEDQGDNIAYIFNDGFTRNPTLKLYRGQTYRFEIDTPGHPLAFSLNRSFTPGSAVIIAGTEGVKSDGLFDAELYGNQYDVGDFIVLPNSGSVTFENDDNVSTIYPDGIRKIGLEGEEIANVYVEKGIIEFTIPFNSPGRLFYISKNDIDTSGLINIYDIEENSFLNIEDDIIGKKTYKSSNGVELSNGMKIYFQGTVIPEKYETGMYYVEGVGSKIELISTNDLIIPAIYSTDIENPFDVDKFDTLPFENSSGYAKDKDYLVSNRGSKDRNTWSRYNKWFHKDVIEQSFIQNKLPVNIDESARAKRPIIEFEAGLKLRNFGSQAKLDIDVIDTFTKDVFSTIEGSLGYIVDGLQLSDGMRVIFAADTDILVNGKVYEVKFIDYNNQRQISLVETNDSIPLENETVLVKFGQNNSGKSFWYNGSNWVLGQEKTKTNQPPLFDLCCPEGNLYSDPNIFESTTFKGTKIFSYKEGEGIDDSELGFPLEYRNIENSGDIVFEFNLLTDTFTYQTDDDVIDVETRYGNLRKYSDRTNFKWVNGWSSTPTKSKQKVLKQINATTNNSNNFEVDVFDRAGDLNDLLVNVYVNDKLQYRLTDYEIDRVDGRALVRFYNSVNPGDVVLIKAYSETPKNENGWYEFPSNLERNPLNQNMETFTLGEVIDHVDSMIEDLSNFKGTFPGRNNLRDLGELDHYGKRFLKHTGPINLPLYHFTNKNNNIVKALEYANSEYSKFKRNFIEEATNYGYDGPIKNHLDLILDSLNKDKNKTRPFYFSDMLSYGKATRIEYTILDPNSPYYALSKQYDVNELSNKSVYLYINGVQLSYGVDYTFDSENGFVLVNANQQEQDILEIFEYENTDGSFIPPTPTKLGLFPKYEPRLIIDDTYLTDETPNTGPFKIYGEIDNDIARNNTRGWFYPIYKSRREAIDADPNGEVVNLQFAGATNLIFAPKNTVVYGARDSIEYSELVIGEALIQGHDGSLIKAYKDFRDNLLIELEKRIFNNIKQEYGLIDINNFVSGKFRDTGFTLQDIDNTIIKDFIQWTKLINTDYTEHYFYDRSNEFTYNYSNMNYKDGELLPGFWRGIYKSLFDTDRPNSHPWEMLGFTIKPSWWNEVYGPAPYTLNNGVLWKDLEDGVIREPNKKPIYLEKYARPGLTTFIPVDEQGKLRSPVQSNIATNFTYRRTNFGFKFGDHSPVETAWRRSSEYPFAIIKAYLLNKPAEIMGLGFDLSRIYKNLSNQYVYSDTKDMININNLALPNTYNDDQRVLTSGLVNYLYNLIAGNILKTYSDYKTDLENITHQLGSKLAGYTNKDNFKIILDSRSPRESLVGGIFVPEENYKIILNTSTPISSNTYSAVVLEKVPSGFVVNGYNVETPYFNYNPFISSSNDSSVTVGGISETTNDWRENTRYEKGQVVENNNLYYRVINSFTSGSSFDTNNLAKLPELPIKGGKTALIRSSFNKNKIETLNYGTLLRSTQEVIDFLLGYGSYLESIGFEFNFFNNETEFVENWTHSAKEFLFWTTQGWAEGTTISLSPSSAELIFNSEFSVADDIFDEFYTYSILKSDGLPIPSTNLDIERFGNKFVIRPKNIDDGIYNIRLNLVQKEHVLLLDNKTFFSDIIYQPTTGYRQERLKVNGYKTDEWNGSLNIPGFVFDNVVIYDWEEYKDFDIGDIVKYKEFYYVALYQVSGSETFESSYWYRLNEKPESNLITNFDYRINQFMDFYDLDSDNFDSEQQRLAQHLIGYQKREYLANIINDDVSQYKFYQGMLQDKGTKNAIEKLFSPLSSKGEESLELFEEWALQVGRYGAVDAYEQIEFNLDETKFLESPQAIEITDFVPSTPDKIYRIASRDIYDRPSDYNNNRIFPTSPVEEYLPSSGYVNIDDVEYTTGSVSGLEDSNFNQVDKGSYVWVADNDERDWTVYQTTNIVSYATSLISTSDTVLLDSIYELTLDRWSEDLFNEGDFVSIKGAEEYQLTGAYRVSKVDFNKVFIRIDERLNVKEFEDQNFAIIKLRKVRASNINEANSIVQEKLFDQQKLWVDDYANGEWAVLQNKSVYNPIDPITNPSIFDSTNHEFASEIAVTKNNNNLFVGAPGDIDGKVYHYRRSKDSNAYAIEDEFSFSNEPDDWQPRTDYALNEIVRFDEDSTYSYWKSKRNHKSGQNFDSTEASANWNEIDYKQFETFDVRNSQFGASLDVTSDGSYLAIGMPTVSNVKTRYKGEFNPDIEYTKGDIVKYRESYWKAKRSILPEIASQPFSTFDSYVSIAARSEIDSTSINLLVSGNPGLGQTEASHFLVRAPYDMYIGSLPDYKLTLAWNIRSYAFPELKNYFPWNNEIPFLDFDAINKTHIIKAKIDHVMFVDTYVSLPQPGDIVVTDTGRATVYYVDVRLDSAVIYCSDTNGIIDINGEVFRVDPNTSDEQFIGFYTTEETYNASSELGGFWFIGTGYSGNPAFPSNPSDYDEYLEAGIKYRYFDGSWDTVYNNQGRYFDIGQGLVYVDLIPDSNTDVNRPFLYDNIQNTISAIGTFIDSNQRASYIENLSQKFISNTGEEDRLTNFVVIRGSKNYTDFLNTNYVDTGSLSNPTFNFALYNLDNRVIDTDSAGLSYDILNKEHILYDLWDGYIDAEFNNFDASGFPFEPEAKFKWNPSTQQYEDNGSGDIIEDVQTAVDEFGNFRPDSDTTSSAEIMFLQRGIDDSQNKIRMFIKITSGTWNLNNDTKKYEIRRTANNLFRTPDVDRTMAIVDSYNNQVVLGNDLIGQLIVIRTDETLPATTTTTILDEEYSFFKEITESGLQRESNPPYSSNKDYSQVFHLKADEFGYSGFNNEGAVAIYRKTLDGTYKIMDVYTSIDQQENKQFGHKVKLSLKDKRVTLFVASLNDTKTNGSLEIFYHGPNTEDVYKGLWKSTENYETGDYVSFAGRYYKANKNVSEQNVDSIYDDVLWTDVSWQIGKDPDFRGEYNNSYPYDLGAIVSYNGDVYSSKTNIPAGQEFTLNNWTQVTNNIDYLGYLPNLTSSNFYNSNVFDPVENIQSFASDFDVSENGEVLVIKSIQEESDSTTNTTLVIYRKYFDQYIFDQIILSPSDEVRFAEKFSISPDGNQLAITEILNDENGVDSGKVYIYKLTDRYFRLDQEIFTPSKNSVNEKFGYAVDFGHNNLLVSSLNGDIVNPTTFDKNIGETTFDQKYTSFRNINYDRGIVYAFENVNDSYIFSESFDFNQEYLFGETLLSNYNHIYVGVPSSGNDAYKGIVTDFRKNKDDKNWSILRQQVPSVDIKKIKSAFLYNKKTNQIITYLDFIDPIQGKIAGVVDQLLDYKIPYDPARFNFGRGRLIDSQNYWAKEYVGKVWWNIKTAKFVYPYTGNTNYQKDIWNVLQPESLIQINEWVESDVPPSEYDRLSSTQEGRDKGYAGISLYGDLAFTQTLVYDEVSKTFGNKYYFWVTNKDTIVNKDNATLSPLAMTRLISQPREEGYRFISFLSNNKMVLNNVKNLIYDKDVVLNIQYTYSNVDDQNLHSAYQIVSEGLDTSELNSDIERKWIDSLIGVDAQARPVPDINLSVRQKFGIQNRPRQGMFINRAEALKQVIERINLIFKENILVDTYDLSDLLEKEPLPTINSRVYDQSIDTESELRFISTNKVEKAVLSPVVLNGKIVRVDIKNSGRGYKVAPSYTIAGNGNNAEFEIEINNLGQIVNVNILNSGSGYGEDTKVEVRRFAVLVKNDSTINGKWAVYVWDENQSQWFKKSIQDYDVGVYWDYDDWYATGYNEFTNIDYIVDEAYQLTALNDRVGEIVKINNVGEGGWLLLEKTADEEGGDYSVNYNTIGRQNGTIQLKDSLYDFSKNTVGYDNKSFDSFFFDNNPSKELRIILNAIKDKIFVSDLKVEYNNLFFSSIRYVLSEQPYVDWLFKTSFVKIRHNVGELEQDKTFDNDKLASYKKYVEEVKPYSTVIREFVSSYNTLDNTQSYTTDFDLPPVYSSISNRILPESAIITDGTLSSTSNDLFKVPRVNWTNSYGYKVIDIKVSDPGEGYTTNPVIKIVGGGGEGATAKAYIGYGKITKIEIINSGSGYTSAPQVIVDGGVGADGRSARCSAILGEGLVRTPSIKIKFDRIIGKHYISVLETIENFIGTATKTVFDLEWPMNMNTNKVKVFVDSKEVLRSQFTYQNVENSNLSYTRKQGQIIFATPPALDSTITVEYEKPLDMLTAEDRIAFGYNPLSNMFGNDLSQLMDGIDYGGVEIRSFDFEGPSGWDTEGWYTDTWDVFDNTFEDEIFTFDGSTTFIELSNPLEDGVVYNVYLKKFNSDKPIRIDDPQFGITNTNNPNAIMPSLIGDDSTKVIDIQDYGITVEDNDILIIRKITSDGSFIPDPESYDTALTGGDLNYETARGVRSEEIIVDGDSFVTPTSSKGPEELVPGQVIDTLDIRVYTRDSGGQGVIYTQNYIVSDIEDNTFDLVVLPSKPESVFVKVNDEILLDDQYEINWIDNTVNIFDLNINDGLSITTMSQSAQDLLDFGTLVSTENQETYELPVKFRNNVSLYVTVDGIKKEVIIRESENGKIEITFDSPLLDNKNIYYAVFVDDNNLENTKLSQATKDMFIGDGSTAVFELQATPFESLPTEHNIIVKVDNTILKAGYNLEFTIPESRQRVYELETFQYPFGTLTDADLKVFLDGEEINSPVDWRLEILNSAIVLSDEIGEPGQKLEIYVITAGEYAVDNRSITFSTPPSDNSKIEIFNFSNHDILGIERQTYDVVSRTTINTDDIQYMTYQRLTVGEISLRTPALNVQYVWVMKNGQLLTPTLDYYLNDDKNKVVLVAQPQKEDTIEIIHFSGPASVSKFAFRQFKDMLNRTHFKRLDEPATFLAQDLNQYDLRIEVADGSLLPEPDKTNNKPGIIFIEGERIEYFVKEENTLRQLRRGTLGTGVLNIVKSGTDVYDQSISKNIPYKDETQVQTIQGLDELGNLIVDGNKTVFDITLPKIRRNDNNELFYDENEFEVFVAGRRLRKGNINVFNPTLGLDSPIADEISLAEFTIDAINGTVNFKTPPEENTKISIIRKIGKTWVENGETLSESQNDIGYFLRAGTTKLPE